MDAFSATLRQVVELLETAGIRYHLTGGLASTLYGEPRFTQDIDLVVGLGADPDDLARLLDLAAGRYLVDEAGAAAEVQRSGLLQLLDLATYVKIDLHIGEGIPGETGRSVLMELAPGLLVPVVSVEDAVVSKLLWCSRGFVKSRTDVLGILRRAKDLDEALVERLCAALGIENLLIDIRRELASQT